MAPAAPCGCGQRVSPMSRTCRSVDRARPGCARADSSVAPSNSRMRFNVRSTVVLEAAERLIAAAIQARPAVCRRRRGSVGEWMRRAMEGQ